MAEGAGRIDTSWQPGNGERKKGKGPGISHHSRVHSRDPVLPNGSHFLSFYHPQISTITGGQTFGTRALGQFLYQLHQCAMSKSLRDAHPRD